MYMILVSKIRRAGMKPLRGEPKKEEEIIRKQIP